MCLQRYDEELTKKYKRKRKPIKAYKDVFLVNGGIYCYEEDKEYTDIDVRHPSFKNWDFLLAHDSTYYPIGIHSFIYETAAIRWATIHNVIEVEIDPKDIVAVGYQWCPTEEQPHVAEDGLTIVSSRIKTGKLLTNKEA